MTRATTDSLRFHPRHAQTSSYTNLHVARLYELIGVEKDLNESARVLRGYVQSERPPVVGAHHITCSDETERECVEAFQRNFVRYLLPSLTFSEKSSFRTANLGARYEWNSVRIAEDHYALAQKPGEWKIQVVKLNSHVCVEETPEGPSYGRMTRYRGESACCGALAGTLAGAVSPFSRELGETFGAEGFDRLAILRDPDRVPERFRSLFAAVLNARLQARRAMIDLQDYEPLAPTLYLVLPCVTINRHNHDTELLCGIYTSDRRTDEAHDEYCGLGDDPSLYSAEVEMGSVRVTDPHVQEPRIARDHRQLVRESWATAERRSGDEQALDRAIAQFESTTGDAGTGVAKAGLRTLLAILFELSPIPAAMLLFGEGLVGIHHASKAHRLAREANDDEAAREMLEEVRPRLEELTPEQAEHLKHLLLQDLRR